MTITSPTVKFGLFTQGIRKNMSVSVLTFNPEQPFDFGAASDLVNSAVDPVPYITYEPNYWLLDGSYKFISYNDDGKLTHIGYMGTGMSDASGVLAGVPSHLVRIVFQFDKPYDLTQVSLHFSDSGDWATQISLYYYDSLGNLLLLDTPTPTGVDYTANNNVAGVDHIRLFIQNTNNPYRYPRLASIDFGPLVVFTGADIKSCSVVQDADPISATLPIGTLDLVVYTSLFNIADPTGDYAQLQNNQPLDVFETVDGMDVYIGRFYLQSWSNTNVSNEIEFKAVDQIGVLNSMTYFGDMWETGTTLDTILHKILDPIGVPYQLDSAIAGDNLYGFLPVGTYRDALQQLGFAAGAVITCARSNAIRIIFYFDISAFAYTLDKSQKSMQQNLSLSPQVTGVEITTHSYQKNNDSVTILNASLSAGIQTIVFNQPYHDLVVTGATVISKSANYVTINVASPGTVTITGGTYTDNQQVQGQYNTSLPAGTPTNIVSITNATFVLLAISNILPFVYDYYQRRYDYDLTLYGTVIEPGIIAQVATPYGNSVRGVIEKMSSDLAGGFVSKIKVVGELVS